MAREINTVSLNDMLARLAKGWQREQEYNLGRLKQDWPRIAQEPWMQRVVPRSLDENGRLVVEVPTSSAVRMELQRRGDRWQCLLDAVRAVCPVEITDLVIDRPGYRAGR